MPSAALTIINDAGNLIILSITAINDGKSTPAKHSNNYNVTPVFSRDENFPFRNDLSGGNKKNFKNRLTNASYAL